MSTEEMLSPAEFARPLRVSHFVVLRELRAGKLPGVKIGKCWRIGKNVLDEMLTRARGGGGSGAESKPARRSRAA